MNDIVDLDHKSAVTIFSSIEITRDNPNDELGVVDLENYISQAIWKLFDTLRAEAAERLGINEVDLLLTDARIMGIKIDGHKVIDPRGFTGSSIEVFLAITMVRRDKFVEDSYMLEGGSVRAYLLSKTSKSDNAVYLEIGENGTVMYLISPSKISYVSDFDWGSNVVIKAIQESLGILPESAGEVYFRYADGNLSSHVSRKLDKIFYESFGDFVNGTAMGIKNFSRSKTSKLLPIYVKSFIPIPESVHSKRFSLDKRRVRLIPANNHGGLREFVGDEAHEIYQELNHLAQRRIKWLIPDNQYE